MTDIHFMGTDGKMICNKLKSGVRRFDGGPRSTKKLDKVTCYICKQTETYRRKYANESKV